MKFTDIFIRRPVLALVVSLLILLIGAEGDARRCRSGSTRKLSNTTITVTTAYPGASPDLIQGFITTPIEQAVATAEGIDYLTSSSIQGTSTVTAYIKLNYDPSQALTDVMAKVQQVKYLMPNAGAGPGHPEIDRPDDRGHVYRLRQRRVVGRGDLRLSDPRRAAAARDGRRRRLGRHPRRPDLRDAAVARPGAHGGARHLGQRRRRGDPRQQLPVGAGPGERLLHRHQRRRPTPGSTDVDQFKRMVVKAADGAVVRLEDIATVDLGAQSWTSSVVMNGQHAVFIGVQATPTGNPLTLVKGVRAAAARDRAQPAALGQDAGRLRFDASSSRPRSTRSNRRSAEAVVIVVVVIFLFLGSFRSVLIPIVTIPLSLIGAGDHHGGARLQPQPADPAGDGAGDRARRRRRDRRARKRLPPYRGGQERRRRRR